MVNLIVPPFVNHDGGAIYSIDCHPSGEKFLTCGQGDLSRSGVVTVWNTAPILSEKAYSDNKIPRILFQIPSQSGANCGRWAPDGKRFAVGSDDSTVSVFEFAGRVNSAGTVLGKAANIERYKECATLRSHAMEVLGVEWSQNGKYLASCSIDNHICIWNAKKLSEKVTTLKDHTGPVKGMCFDPIGKYFASISSDKTLKIWQTDNWQCITTIGKPFEDSGQTTMFSRMDWSPDGKFLFAPSATNNKAPTVQLVERQTWNIDRDLVGHRKATTCVRVLPRILCTETKNGKKTQFTCVAVGSRDRGISVWLLPGISRPVLVINRVFKHSVLDMMWNDLTLTACSQDGSVVVLSFDDHSLGECLTASAMSDLCDKIYCIRPPQYENNGTVMIEEESNGFSSSAADSSLNSSFITCPEEVIARRKKEDEAAKQSSENGNTILSNGTVSSSTDGNKQNDEKTKMMEKEKQLIEERSKQVEETKDGKRRIQPIFLASTSTGDVISSSAPITSIKRIPTTDETVRKKKSMHGEDEEDLDETSSEEDEEEDEEMEVDGDSSEEEDITDDDRRRKKKSRKLRNQAKMTSNQMLAADFKKPVLRPTEMPSMKVTPGTVVMDVPEQQSFIIHHLPDRKGQMVEVDNKWKHSGIESTCVKLVKRKNQVNPNESVEDLDSTKILANEQLWIVAVGAPVLMVAANKHFVVLGCGDRCLRVYKTNCGSLVTCLRLDSLPISIGIREYAAYVLTEYGKLSTWELRSLKWVMSRQPIFECVETSKDTSLASLDVSENGIPLMVLSNGSVYTYNVGLACWVQVITSNVVSRLAAPFTDAQLSDGPLGRLLKRMRRVGTAPNVAPAISKSVKESQVEQLLHCSEILANSNDYQSMLMLYVETLCENGNEKKLKNVINDLTKNGAPIIICGLRRAALYDDVTKMIESRQPSIAAKILTINANKKTSLF